MNLAELQRRLAALGLYTGKVDGDYGRLTSAAIVALYQHQHFDKKWDRWPAKRRIAAAQQLICRIDGIEVGAIDGLVGEQTRYAFEVYADRKRGSREAETWRDALPEPTTVPPPSVWPRQTTAEMTKFFGPIGSNTRLLQLPYPMRIAWDMDKIITRFAINARCAESAERAMKRAFDHYGFEKIKDLGLDRFGGCLNVRRMRGGSNWSTHAFAAAIDFDPTRNQLRWGRDRAEMGKPAYVRWFEFWENEGWVSLGRSRNFDFMHVQAVRL